MKLGKHNIKKEPGTLTVLLLVAGLGLFTTILLVVSSASASATAITSYGEVRGARQGVPQQTASPTLTANPDNPDNPTPTCPLAWREVSNARSGDVLDIDALAANDVWAVGTAPDGTMALHWDGQQWTRVQTPNYNTAANVLLSVNAISANDIWAAGYYYTGNFGVDNTLTMHWDGNIWSLVPSPNFGNADNRLYGVAALSPNNVWAVGVSFDQSPENTNTTLALHWNGNVWAKVPTPAFSVYAAFVYGVAAVSSNDIWAVGTYFRTESSNSGAALVMHWDGSTWSPVSTPNVGAGSNFFTSISVVTANDIWAVGGYQTQFTQGLIEHWDGLAWSVVPSPVVGEYYSRLNDMTVIAANDIWAVGYYNTRTNLTEHWDGTAWSVVDSPTLGDYDALNGVAAVSATDVWAVGHYEAAVVLYLHYSNECPPPTPTPTMTTTATVTASATATAVLPSATPTSRYSPTVTFTAVPTGTSTATPTPTLSSTPTPTNTPIPPCGPAWRPHSSPNIGASLNILEGVAAVSADDIWSVGYYYTGGRTQSLILHYSGTAGQWQIVPSPNAGTSSNLPYAVDAVSANDVWAVGYYFPGTGGSQVLTLHYTNGQWQVVPGPTVSAYGSRLYGVAAISSDDVWAVGFTYDQTNGETHALTIHYTSGIWQEVQLPGIAPISGLYGVQALSSNDIWAVGYSDSQGFAETLTLHFSNGEWQVVPSPTAGSNPSFINGVTIVSSDDVWAVGYYSLAPNVYRTLTLHYTSGQWNMIPSPNVEASSFLSSVTAASADDIWAVGFYHNGNNDLRRTLTMHYTGGQWQVVPSPHLGPDISHLTGVVALSAGDVWSVGYYCNDCSRTLTLHYSDPCSLATPTSTVLPSVTRTGTSTISSATATSTAAASSTSVRTVTSTSTPLAATSTRASTATTAVASYTPTSVLTVAATSTGTRQPASPTATATVGTPGASSTETFTSTPTSIMTASVTPTICTISFTDVSPDSTFYPFIRCLACRGIISGYSDGSFRPGNDITRGQIAKMVSNAAGFQEDPGLQDYEDVAVGSPFYAWVNRLSNRGFMGGYECGLVPEEPCIAPNNYPYFRSNASATRGQISKIVSNAAGIVTTPSGQFYTDVPAGHTFYLWIMRLTELGVMSGYPCGVAEGEPCDSESHPYFRPYNNVTRRQASKIVANTFFPNCQTPFRR